MTTTHDMIGIAYCAVSSDVSMPLLAIAMLIVITVFTRCLLYIIEDPHDISLFISLPPPPPPPRHPTLSLCRPHTC